MNSRPGQLRVADYVEHILGACGRIQEYMQGLSKEVFLQDSRTQDAVIRNILVVGEAAAQILDNHPAFVLAQSAIPWNQMKGMRNRMFHGYFETNLELVWETVRAFIPDLSRQLKSADCSGE